MAQRSTTKLWGLVDVQRNRLELVKVKGGSKRQKALVTLTSDEFLLLLDELKEPFRTMAVIAMCTGLRISEVLALCWESLNFEDGTMLMERAVVNGRIVQQRLKPLKMMYLWMVNSLPYFSNGRQNKTVLRGLSSLPH